MSDQKKPPTSQELADEIQRLKDDVASFKKRFAAPPSQALEEALAALSKERPHPLSPEEKYGLSDEIRTFRDEISILKAQIAETEEKLGANEDEEEADS